MKRYINKKNPGIIATKIDNTDYYQILKPVAGEIHKFFIEDSSDWRFYKDSYNWSNCMIYCETLKELQHLFECEQERIKYKPKFDTYVFPVSVTLENMNVYNGIHVTWENIIPASLYLEMFYNKTIRTEDKGLLHGTNVIVYGVDKNNINNTCNIPIRQAKRDMENYVFFGDQNLRDEYVKIRRKNFSYDDIERKFVVYGEKSFLKELKKLI